MSRNRRSMVISPLWLQFSVLTFLVGFTVLGILAVSIYRNHPPIPEKVLADDGNVLFTRAQIMAGQEVFQKNGLMEFGSIFGHGAYLGPDFTAQYLHEASEAMIDVYGGRSPDVFSRVQSELQSNAYDPATETLVFSVGQAEAFRRLSGFYEKWFGRVSPQEGLKRPFVKDRDKIRNLTAYFSWAAWTTTARRPGTDYSYTNNWPPESLAANRPSTQAFVWSVYSLIALLGGIGLVLFLFGRFNVLGWHRRTEEEPSERVVFRPPEEVTLSPVQRVTAWYFAVMAVLFAAQGLLGGLNAHYHVDPTTFYGFDLGTWLPYHLSRMWHLQLAIFFVAIGFLAIGLFLTPLITRRQPPHQEKWAVILLGAVALVVVGSLAGEGAALKDLMPRSSPWFWIGSQGWEYLDLGRFWQILLTVGLAGWVALLVRGMRTRLSEEHPGNLPYLFLFSAFSIPTFYAVGMLFGKNTHFAVMDFWRFWVVHLWVEDFLELFTTIMVAYIFVLLGVVKETTATRVVYLDIILYSVGGVIGTMHHLYFSGAPAVHMALGAFFSAMEVVPLVLLTVEAWRFIQLGRWRREETGGSVFPHRWAVMFLIAVGFWNFLGAGMFGFLINLPIVSYYEIGTAFTANHAHGAMMGVYGMLAVGFFMFAARYFLPQEKKVEWAMKISFWSLNLGLGWMIFANLIPLGILQLQDSYQFGYWHARRPEFFTGGAVRLIEWFRMPGDTLFIVGGILPIVYLAIRMIRASRQGGKVAGVTEDLTLVTSSRGEGSNYIH